MTKKCKLNVNGTWKESKPKVNVNGTWKDVKKGWVKINDEWKVFYEKGGGQITTASVTFDATKFASVEAGYDDGVLTYTGDLAGKLPVHNTSTTLAKATDEGSWGFDTTSTDIDVLGTNMLGMYYCTFTSAGVRHEKLDPYNLAQYIATWDATNSKWVAGTGASSITTENTMLMIPTLYWKGESTGFTISQDSSKGTAYAHTIGGKTYKWLAIGVYCSYNSSSKAMSLSGKQATGSVKRADWRTYSSANTVSGGYAMQWNYYQWMLMRMLAYLSCKSFQCQGLIGQGGNDYSSGVTGGCDALGPYAGDVSGTASTCKCLIEDFWGYKEQFIDDVLVGKSDGKIYVGQNANPNDTGVTDKTAIAWATFPTGFPSTISTGDLDWGLGSNASGSKTIGLCDSQYVSTSTAVYKLLAVGEYSYDVSAGTAGPGYVFSYALTHAYARIGSRLAFVLD